MSEQITRVVGGDGSVLWDRRKNPKLFPDFDKVTAALRRPDGTPAEAAIRDLAAVAFAMAEPKTLPTWCNWLLGGETELSRVLADSSAPRRICGYVFTRGDIAWNCRQCQMDSTCVQCDACFSRADHTGHEVHFHRTVQGCCDCGDLEAWAAGGCCTRHRPSRSEEADPIERLPENFCSAARIVVAELLGFVAGAAWDCAAGFEKPPDHPWLSGVWDPSGGGRFSPSLSVVLYNDDVHSFEHVIQSLTAPPLRMSQMAAARTAENVHQKGSHVVAKDRNIDSATRILAHLQERGLLACAVPTQASEERATRSLALLRWLSSVCAKSEGICRLIGNLLCSQLPYAAGQRGDTAFVRPLDRKSRFLGAQLKDVGNSSERLEPLPKSAASPTEAPTYYEFNEASYKDAPPASMWEPLANTPLAILMLSDAVLPPPLRATLHGLYMRLLVGQTFKKDFSVIFTRFYRRLSEMHCECIGTSDDSLFGFSVQLYTTPSILGLLMAENQIVDSYALIQPSNEAAFAAVQAFANANRVPSQGHWGQYIPRNGLASVLIQAALDTFATAGRKPPIGSNGKPRTKDEVLDSPIVTSRRFAHVFRDLEYVFQNTESATMVAQGSTNPGPGPWPLVGWLALLTSFEGMERNQRVTTAHVEYESSRWIVAFGLSLALASINDILVDRAIVGPTLAVSPVTAGGFETAVSSVTAGGFETAVSSVTAGGFETAVSSVTAGGFETAVSSGIGVAAAAAAAGAAAGEQAAAAPAQAVPSVAAAAKTGHALVCTGTKMLREYFVKSGELMCKPCGDSRSVFFGAESRPVAPLPLSSRVSYAVHANGVSLHLPLFRFFARVILALAEVGLPLPQGCEDVNDSPKKVLHSTTDSATFFFDGLVEFPLRALVFEAQVSARLWIRNGSPAASQAVNYTMTPLCRSLRDLDLVNLQLGLVRMGADVFLLTVMERYTVDRWLLDPAFNPPATDRDGSSSFEKAHYLALTEEMFALLIVLATELPPPPGPRETRQRAILRREMVHRLALGECTHSEVSKVATNAGDNISEVDLASVLKDVATVSGLEAMGENSGSARAAAQPRRYDLSNAAAAEYDPVFFHMSRAEHQAAAERVASKRRALRATQTQTTHTKTPSTLFGATTSASFDAVSTIKQQQQQEQQQSSKAKEAAAAAEKGEAQTALPLVPPLSLAHAEFLPVREMLLHPAILRSCLNSLKWYANKAQGRFSEVLLLRTVHLMTLQMHVAVAILANGANFTAKDSTSMSMSSGLGTAAVSADSEKDGRVAGGGSKSTSMQGSAMVAFATAAAAAKSDATVSQSTSGSSSSSASAAETFFRWLTSGEDGGRPYETPPIEAEAAAQLAAVFEAAAVVKALTGPTPPAAAAALGSVVRENNNAADEKNVPQEKVVSTPLSLLLEVWEQHRESRSGGHLLEEGIEWLLSEAAKKDKACENALIAHRNKKEAGVGAERGGGSGASAAEQALGRPGQGVSTLADRKRKAQQQAMAAMARQQASFAMHLAAGNAASMEDSDSENEEKDEENGGGELGAASAGLRSAAEGNAAAAFGGDKSGQIRQAPPLPECIMCHERSDQPVAYMGLLQRSLVLGRGIRNNPHNELLTREYVTVGEIGCQVRASIEMDSDEVGLLRPGQKAVVLATEQVGRRVRIVYPLNGWASVQSSEGYPVLVPVTEWAWQRWGSQRIHANTCGHAVHVECWDKYFATVLNRNMAHQAFDGRESIDLARGEYFCPMCKALSNALVPYISPESSLTASSGDSAGLSAPTFAQARRITTPEKLANFAAIKKNSTTDTLDISSWFSFGRSGQPVQVLSDLYAALRARAAAAEELRSSSSSAAPNFNFNPRVSAPLLRLSDALDAAVQPPWVSGSSADSWRPLQNVPMRRLHQLWSAVAYTASSAEASSRTAAILYGKNSEKSDGRNGSGGRWGLKALDCATLRRLVRVAELGLAVFGGNPGLTRFGSDYQEGTIVITKLAALLGGLRTVPDALGERHSSSLVSITPSEASWLRQGLRVPSRVAWEAKGSKNAFQSGKEPGLVTIYLQEMERSLQRYVGLRHRIENQTSSSSSNSAAATPSWTLKRKLAWFQAEWPALNQPLLSWDLSVLAVALLTSLRAFPEREAALRLLCVARLCQVLIQPEFCAFGMRKAAISSQNDVSREVSDAARALERLRHRLAAAVGVQVSPRAPAGRALFVEACAAWVPFMRFSLLLLHATLVPEGGDDLAAEEKNDRGAQTMTEQKQSLKMGSEETTDNSAAFSVLNYAQAYRDSALPAAFIGSGAWSDGKRLKHAELALSLVCKSLEVPTPPEILSCEPLLQLVEAWGKQYCHAYGAQDPTPSTLFGVPLASDGNGGEKAIFADASGVFLSGKASSHSASSVLKGEPAASGTAAAAAAAHAAAFTKPVVGAGLEEDEEKEGENPLFWGPKDVGEELLPSPWLQNAGGESGSSAREASGHFGESDGGVAGNAAAAAQGVIMGDDDAEEMVGGLGPAAELGFELFDAAAMSTDDEEENDQNSENDSEENDFDHHFHNSENESEDSAAEDQFAHVQAAQPFGVASGETTETDEENENDVFGDEFGGEAMAVDEYEPPPPLAGELPPSPPESSNFGGMNAAAAVGVAVGLAGSGSGGGGGGGGSVVAQGAASGGGNNSSQAGVSSSSGVLGAAAFGATSGGASAGELGASAGPSAGAAAAGAQSSVKLTINKNDISGFDTLSSAAWNASAIWEADGDLKAAVIPGPLSNLTGTLTYPDKERKRLDAHLRDLSHLGVSALDRSSLIDLPARYLDLHSQVKSPYCLLNVPNFDPAVCLLCGAVVPAGHRFASSNAGACTLHARTCGGGTGVFFLLHRCVVLLLRDARAAYYPSIYLDEHGEEDAGLRRGRPLHLSAPRYAALKTLWAQHRVGLEVSSLRSSSDRVIRDSFY